MKYATTHVTSSLLESSAAQCAYAVSAISRAARAGSPARSLATPITSSFVMNSNTPSDASTRHRTDASSWYVRSSGISHTPRFFPTASPRDLVNAHPG